MVSGPAVNWRDSEYAFLSQVDLERWQKYPGRVRIYAFGVD